MHYLKVGKSDFLLGAMLILSISGLFASYISPHGVMVAFALFSAGLFFRTRPIAFTAVDIAVCLVTVYELLLPFTSINTPPAYLHTMMGFYLFFSYFLFRFCLTSAGRFRTVLLFLSVAIFFILVVGTVSFLQFRDRVLESGFDSLYEFRHLLAPWGSPNNMWTTFLIAFAGIVLPAYFHYRGHRKATGFLLIVFALLVWNLLGSFSRTTYMLTVLMLIAMTIAVIRVRSRRTVLLLGTFILTVAGFCVLNGTKDVGKTLRLNATSSQQRSIDARYRDYSLLSNSLAGNALFGAGSGNCTLATNGELYEDDDILYTNFVSSGYVQLITEKGILGAILWLILFLSVFISLVAKRSRGASLTAGILVLVALKEVTFAVFADFPNLQCLLIIPIVGALNIPAGTSPLPTLSEKILRISYIPVAALFITCFAAFAAGNARNSKSEDLIADIESGSQPPDAYQALGSAATPHLLNKASLLWESYLHTNDQTRSEEAIRCLRQAIARNPLDNMPRYNLALLYLHQGRTAEASPILQRLVAQYPDNSLYRIGLAQLLSQQGQIPRSAEQYAQAILINPQIMDDPEWKCLKNDNSQLFCYICKEIYRILPYSKKNPVQQAKNGKILWELADTAGSEAQLREAVALLPNLGKAWYNLGLIAAARQDRKQARTYFKKALLFTPDDRPLFDYVHGEAALPASAPPAEGYYSRSRARVYYLKFRTWYKTKPYRNQIYLTTLFGIPAKGPAI